uniref:Uncharacterized protein n=1 Tax=Parascaris equorum TaxID=6256 RepID=A0A914RWG6_PAREQ
MLFVGKFQCGIQHNSLSALRRYDAWTIASVTIAITDNSIRYQILPIKPGAPIFPAAEDVLPEQTTPESDIELLMPDSSEAPDSDVKAPRRKLMQPTAGKSDRNGGNPEEEALCEILIPPANSFYEALLKMTNRVDTFLASITNDADKCKTIFKKLDDLGSSCDALRNRAAGASAAC